jgi:phosphoribosylanthranilate isomerase
VPVKIKICGMRDPANIETVAALRPDYLGFIEYAASPRYVGRGFLPPALPPGISRVGVFVNESFEYVQQRITLAGYDAVQLHGDESPDFCTLLRDEGVQVIKVFRVDDTFDFEETKSYAHHADLFLFDARGRQPGGNGIRFDPAILQRYDQRVPFFLSGGLRPDMLEEDIAGLDGMNLHGMDVNSGVEHSPGLKDVDKVRASIDHVRKK